jgi:hypothetical protein
VKPGSITDPNLRRQRVIVMTGGLIAFPLTAVLWFAVRHAVPALTGMTDPLARLIFALQCCGVAILFCFATGIEAVAHERLSSAGIDPLSGYQSRRMTINLRYLQNTLEQLVLFVPGLLMLAVDCRDGDSMRAVVATAVVWIVARGAFWIGYHYGSSWRVVGLGGMVQSLIVLLYVSSRVGFDIAGPVGAGLPLVLFASVEVWLVWATWSPAR